jgi:hypothetical protein
VSLCGERGLKTVRRQQKITKELDIRQSARQIKMWIEFGNWFVMPDV